MPVNEIDCPTIGPVRAVASDKASSVPDACVEVIVWEGALLVTTVPPEVERNVNLAFVSPAFR